MVVNNASTCSPRSNLNRQLRTYTNNNVSDPASSSRPAHDWSYLTSNPTHNFLDDGNLNVGFAMYTTRSGPQRCLITRREKVARSKFTQPKVRAFFSNATMLVSEYYPRLERGIS